MQRSACEQACIENRTMFFQIAAAHGIVIERKAISRNISLLKEAGIEIESRRAGSYLEERDFEDSELKLLIDGVLCSKHTQETK